MKKYPLQTFTSQVLGNVLVTDTKTRPVIFEYIDSEGNFGITLSMSEYYAVSLEDVVKDL
jgi:hypothetical protein